MTRTEFLRQLLANPDQAWQQMTKSLNTIGQGDRNPADILKDSGLKASIVMETLHHVLMSGGADMKVVEFNKLLDYVVVLEPVAVRDKLVQKFKSLLDGAAPDQTIDSLIGDKAKNIAQEKPYLAESMVFSNDAPTEQVQETFVKIAGDPEGTWRDIEDRFRTKINETDRFGIMGWFLERLARSGMSKITMTSDDLNHYVAYMRSLMPSDMVSIDKLVANFSKRLSEKEQEEGLMKSIDEPTGKQERDNAVNQILEKLHAKKITEEQAKMQMREWAGNRKVVRTAQLSTGQWGQAQNQQPVGGASTPNQNQLGDLNKSVQQATRAWTNPAVPAQQQQTQWIQAAVMGMTNNYKNLKDHVDHWYQFVVKGEIQKAPNLIPTLNKALDEFVQQIASVKQFIPTLMKGVSGGATISQPPSLPVAASDRNGKTIKLSKSEWLQIGKTAGWFQPRLVAPDGPVKQRGSQMRQKIEDSEYDLFKRLSPEEVILTDTDTGKKELWALNDDHSGFTVEIRGRGYEFVRGWKDDTGEENAL